MSTIITVWYDELIEGFQEGCNERGPWAKKPYRVNWGDRFTFANEIQGRSSVTGISAPWTRTLPYQYPPSPNMYARDCTIEPLGDVVAGVQPITFQYALVTVNFGIPEFSYQISDDPLFLSSISQDPTENQSLQFCSQEIEYGVEWIQVPKAPATYESDGAKVVTSLSKRVNVTRLILTWHRFPVLPISTIRTYADSVNNNTFLGGNRGTVFFEGVKTVREASSDGTMTQKVQMSLKWRANDWNEFLRPDDNTWDTVIYNGDSTQTTYPYKDFGVMLALFG